MIINTNIQALVTNGALNKKNKLLQTNSERLSSGLKINSSKDNPSGFAISKKS